VEHALFLQHLRASVVPQAATQRAHIAQGTVRETHGAHGRPARMCWASLLKCAFDTDLERRPNCGAGELKIVAAMLERRVIEKILVHLGLRAQPSPRAPARELTPFYMA
jgi:hypothetical protein